MRDAREAELDAWMGRLSEGDRGAFDPLFRALYPRAIRLARLRVASDQSADAAQSILMKVFARASEFESGKPVLPWFYAVAANELRTWSRRNARQHVRVADEMSAHGIPASDDPERILLEHELRLSLERAVSSLDADSVEAIACMLEQRPAPSINAPALRKRISRAYAKLRLLLGGLREE